MVICKHVIVSDHSPMQHLSSNSSTTLGILIPLALTSGISFPSAAAMCKSRPLTLLSNLVSPSTTLESISISEHKLPHPNLSANFSRLLLSPVCQLAKLFLDSAMYPAVRRRPSGKAGFGTRLFPSTILSERVR